VLRPRLLVSVLASSAVVAAVLVGTVSAASPEGGTVVLVELTLKANRGFHAQLETSDDETVTLELRREGQEVIYETRGEVTEAGLKARFGRLGQIDVAFTPTVTLDSTEPSEECTGEPRTLREGLFTGAIEFSGERGYVQLEGAPVAGSMSVLPAWHCPEDQISPLGKFSRLLGRASTDAERERETASLSAASRRCACFFAAGVHHRHSGGRSIFYGVKAERTEGMKIFRVTSVLARAAAFDFDHEAGTAILRPPSPLSGEARFERRPHAEDLWRSTIRVPLLGVAPLRTDGPGFRAGLHREYQFD
jgi:hypothetical protein